MKLWKIGKILLYDKLKSFYCKSCIIEINSELKNILLSIYNFIAYHHLLLFEKRFETQTLTRVKGSTKTVIITLL